MSDLDDEDFKDRLGQHEREHAHCTKRIAKLEQALREIAEHPHCGGGHFTSDSKYQFGSMQGHLCAAKIAREALEESK